MTGPPISDPGRRRWVVPALAAAAVVVIAATVLITSLLDDTRQSATPTTTTARAEPSATDEPADEPTDEPTGAPTDEPTTSELDTTSEQAPESTGASTPDAATVAAFVRDHFANLPHDAATARQNWAPENRPSDWEDDQFWSAYRAVALSGEPEVTADGATYTVDVTLELTPQDDADPVIADCVVVVVARDDRLLVISLDDE